jgi:ubiquitin C-terminal hydrolase
LHLKRFRFHDKSRLKIDTHVAFPFELDMKQFVPNPDPHSDHLYYLYAVIVHRGTSGSGHYIAYINNQGRWFEMNDRKVTMVTNDQVLEQNAYMLFYDLNPRRKVPKLEPVKIPKKRKSSMHLDQAEKVK